MLQLPSLSLDLNLGRRRSATDVVGLDVQPGFVAAVKARVNGTIAAERAAFRELDTNIVREGDVVDVEALSEALRELFADSGLGKRVRVGIASQRSVMRTLELPPVTDRKELAAAVAFQAQDQVPMPLSSAVMDFHPLGVVDTADGPRQRVVLVAAQRDMVDRLLAAVRGAHLTPVGIDLSAFALIRSLCSRGEADAGRVLYLNVDGLTNLAIADGDVCLFTRVVGGGVESMAGELATRRAIPLGEARALLATVDLGAPPAHEPAIAVATDDPGTSAALADGGPSPEGEDRSASEAAGSDELAPPVLSREEHEAREASMGFRETAEQANAPALEPELEQPPDDDIRRLLENGVRELTGEIRNSLDFHRAQDHGAEISHVSLSGAALDLPGFQQALQESLGIEVRREVVEVADKGLERELSTNRLSIATGLATVEAPR